MTRCIVNPLYKSTHYNSNILYNVISYAQNGYIILICILYNSKFSLTSKFLGTNAAFVNRIHCITIISSILIIYYYYVIAKHEETALVFILMFLSFID